MLLKFLGILGITIFLSSGNIHAAGECNPSLPATCTPSNAADLINCVLSLNASGGGIIDLGNATYTFNTPYLLTSNALPAVTSAITFRNGSIERDTLSANFFRLIFVASTGNVSLCNIRLSNGYDDSLQGGGAIFADTGSGMNTVDQSTFSNNVSTRDGGALYLNGLLTTLSNSTFNNNTASYLSAVSGNGGGIFIDELGQITTLYNSTFYQNNAMPAGGAIYVDRSGIVAGSIGNPGDNSGGLFNTTIYGNTTGNAQNFFGFGAGIQNCGIITTLTSNILAQNYIPGTPLSETDFDGCSGLGVLGPSFNNIIGSNQANSFASNDPNNLVGTSSSPLNAHLAPLANNGGLTQTLAALSNSPAIGYGSNPLNLVFDQRGAGFPRETNGLTDSGSFQAQAAQGPQGPTGPTGPAGSEGPKGPQGIPGESGTDGRLGNGGSGRLRGLGGFQGLIPVPMPTPIPAPTPIIAPTPAIDEPVIASSQASISAADSSKEGIEELNNEAQKITSGGCSHLGNAGQKASSIQLIWLLALAFFVYARRNKKAYSR